MAAEAVKRPALLERLTGLSMAEFEPFSREYHQQVIEPRVSAPHRVRGRRTKRSPARSGRQTAVHSDV